ncbi:sn-glycerol-1-phosphate dehydrogenase [Paenibacillus sp. GCM10027626]|uniref:sn-glycerol-1-phosphate dehydrogenase n=1 Tax=Paenibacillus sp. GCM10027626 TaxID=3273411 RepID=UPI003642FF91
MTDLVSKIKQSARALGEDACRQVALDMICIDPGALAQVAPYIAGKSYQRVALAADEATYAAAGKELEDMLAAAGIHVQVTLIKPDLQGDVVADERAVIQLILAIQQQQAEAVLAVGGGTIHDIVRYAAYTTGHPFISVPTAPSVDGFNSKGAPLIVRGEKITIPAIGPDAIFADLHVLEKAPASLIAAGFGDMLGKYTSLFDWKFGAIIAGEPYLPVSAELTAEALQQCVAQADLIAAGREEGIRTLITALVQSGLAMLLFGKSHPASGSEHHLSHYWEMEYLRLGKRQLLHGAKVGVACLQISRLYHQLAEQGIALAAEHCTEQQLQQAERLTSNWTEIASSIKQIPQEETLRALLQKVGAPVTTAELGIEGELLARSLREAHLVRPERYTLLRLKNEWGQ